MGIGCCYIIGGGGGAVWASIEAQIFIAHQNFNGGIINLDPNTLNGTAICGISS